MTCDTWDSLGANPSNKIYTRRDADEAYFLSPLHNSGSGSGDQQLIAADLARQELKPQLHIIMKNADPSESLSRPSHHSLIASEPEPRGKVAPKTRGEARWDTASPGDCYHGESKRSKTNCKIHFIELKFWEVRMQHQVAIDAIQIAICVTKTPMNCRL